MKTKLPLRIRNCLILTLPAFPAMLAGSYIHDNFPIALLIALLTGVLLFLIENKVRIVVKTGKKRSNSVDFNAHTDGHFE